MWCVGGGYFNLIFKYNLGRGEAVHTYSIFLDYTANAGILIGGSLATLLD